MQQCTFTPIAERHATFVLGEVLLNPSGFEVATLRPLPDGKWSAHVHGGQFQITDSRESGLQWLREMYPQFQIPDAG